MFMEKRRERLFSASGGMLAVATVMVLMMVGCAKEPSENPENSSTEMPLCFDVSVDNGWNKAPMSRSIAAGTNSEAANELGVTVGDTYKGEEVIGIYKLQDNGGKTSDDKQFYLIATRSNWEVDNAQAAALTRASSYGGKLVTNMDNFYTYFAVWSYWFDGAWEDQARNAIGLSNSSIQTSNPVPQFGNTWQHSDSVRFFACAPDLSTTYCMDYIPTSYPQFDLSDNYMKASSQVEPGIPYIDCIYSGITQYTEDLLYADTTVRGDGRDTPNGVMALNFHHALAAVALMAGDAQQVDGDQYVTPNGTLGLYSLTNVKMQGRFYLDGHWENVDYKDGNLTSATFGRGSSTASGTVGEQITPDNKIMMLIPQTIENTTLTITFNDAVLPDPGYVRTLSAQIPSLTLNAGEKVKLHISVPEITVSYDCDIRNYYEYSVPGGSPDEIKLDYYKSTPIDDGPYSAGFGITALKIYGDKYNARRWDVDSIVTWTVEVLDIDGNPSKLPDWVLVDENSGKFTGLKTTGIVSGRGSVHKGALGTTEDYTDSHQPFLLKITLQDNGTIIEEKVFKVLQSATV